MTDPLGFYFLLGLGLLGILFAARGVRTGEFAGGDVLRHEHPREFWIRVCYLTGLGVVFLFLAIRKFFERGPSQTATRDVCDGYSSAFDCFVGEYLYALVFTVIAVAVPLGSYLWRRYQTRTLDNISAAADRAESRPPDSAG